MRNNHIFGINSSATSYKEYLKYKRSNIPDKYCSYFKLNKTTLQIEKNMKIIKTYLSKMGTFILSTNQQNLDKIDVLTYYRQRDRVEKVFDIVKNELDGNRLRAHSQYNTDGRLFIKFIALIIYTEISKIMKEKNLFKKYTVKELLKEIKKIKITTIEKNSPFLSELSKKQKMILDAFDAKENLLHSY